MPKRPDIYELLAAKQASATTTTQLNSALKSTFIVKGTGEFWSGVITVSRALQESRTYAGGSLPIPETGAVVSVTVADSATESIKPTSSTEVWLVNGINLDGCTAALYDGTTACPLANVADIRTPLYLSEKLFIAFNNGTGSEQTPAIAYHKVSL